VKDASDLGKLGPQIRAHRQKYRSRMFRDLDQAAAALDEAVDTAEA